MSEVQLCMSSNSWTWECPHTKDGADHVPLIFEASLIHHTLYIGLYPKRGEKARQRTDFEAEPTVPNNAHRVVNNTNPIER